MAININNEADVSQVVQTALNRYGTSPDALIPVLTEVNNALGYLPENAMTRISQALRLPTSQLLSTASFYRMLSTQPRGKHVIKFCDSAPCHVMGGRQVWQALKKELGLEPGQTSTDGQWTVLTASCPGICGVGPVLMIDNDVYGNVRPEKIPEILTHYKGGKAS